LKDVEAERQLRKEDLEMKKVSEELMKRCKSYRGQFYELVKPIQSKYDMAVKVSLAKCLRFLVVDDSQGAQYVHEFLKEKSLHKEVLVLENVPDKKITKQQGMTLMSEVIEYSRSIRNLDKAVRYFMGNKVVASSFDEA